MVPTKQCTGITLSYRQNLIRGLRAPLITREGGETKDYEKSEKKVPHSSEKCDQSTTGKVNSIRHATV